MNIRGLSHRVRRGAPGTESRDLRVCSVTTISKASPLPSTEGWNFKTPQGSCSAHLGFPGLTPLPSYQTEVFQSPEGDSPAPKEGTEGLVYTRHKGVCSSFSSLFSSVWGWNLAPRWRFVGLELQQRQPWELGPGTALLSPWKPSPAHENPTPQQLWREDLAVPSYTQEKKA